jgi:hypothetical protein
MSENTFEYIIKQKNEGKALAKKLGLLLGYVAFLGILILLIFFSSPPALFVPLLMISTAITALLIFITWRFVCVEYEVILAEGDISFTAIFGRGFRKRILSLPVLTFTEIGEYTVTVSDESGNIYTCSRSDDSCWFCG